MIRTLPDTSTDVLLAGALDYLFDNGFSFAVWRLPGNSKIFLASAEDTELQSDISLESTRSGFLMSPFQPSREKVFIPADTLLTFDGGRIQSAQGKQADELMKAGISAVTTRHTHYFSRKEGYRQQPEGTFFKQLVARCIEEISKGTFEKIVPSRTKIVEWPMQASPASLFLRLTEAYPRAMVTLVSSPATGTWMGATPEMLARVTADQHFYTAAVAGTQPFHEGLDPRTVAWAQKDIEEQALVERYVISCFKKIRLREYEERGPKTMIAGNVLHLQTEFEVDMVATNFPQLGSVMLKLLHPTSAVCGMPLEPSLAFLTANENYDRQFYSGYLGPVCVEGESQMFVNLRCMQLFQGEAVLYAGAGVIADSDPEKEWMETEMKMNTLLRIIRQ